MEFIKINMQSTKISNLLQGRFSRIRSQMKKSVGMHDAQTSIDWRLIGLASGIAATLINLLTLRHWNSPLMWLLSLGA